MELLTLSRQIAEKISQLKEKINSLNTDIENSDMLRKENEIAFNELINDFDEIKTEFLALNKTKLKEIYVENLSLSQKYLKLSEEAKRFNSRFNKDEKETQVIMIFKRERLMKHSFKRYRDTPMNLENLRKINESKDKKIVDC
ncbi:hypothetical protein BpHYR1_046720 [Brachionus plicatilis]|uniref:Uncharacterized protein n=1 Tax=Brachionus plicatilis TaxID=10195 RepID=A0A3M7SDY8_BRAPC|nr:hypothetical protein BpHYR1_046720 [Brachionus plicatilis]